MIEFNWFNQYYSSHTNCSVKYTVQLVSACQFGFSRLTIYKNKFSCLVEYNPIKLEIIRTVILPFAEIVFQTYALFLQ